MENPSQCFVQLFKLYLSRCPCTAPADVFYLRPLDKPKTEAWYSNQAIGHNKLTTCTTVVRLCKAANIEGFKTNHSLRTTTATRLYHSNHDEQLIMERTGHRSIEGIRNYKRTSERQHQAVSQLLNNASVDDHCTNHSIPPGPLALPPSTSALTSRQENHSTQFQTRCAYNNTQQISLQQPSLPFTLNSCSNITINFNK